MPNFILTNCPFAWTVQEQLNGKIKALPFSRLEEFARVSRILHLFSIQFHPESNFFRKKLAQLEAYVLMKRLRHSLREHLEALVEYVNEPDLYVTVDYIKVDPNQYISSDIEEKNEIIQGLTNETVNNAFYTLCTENLSEQVAFLNNLKENDRQQWILERHEDEDKKAKIHQEFTKHTAPLPGSEASTASTELVRLVGGQHKLDQVIALINQDSHFSNCIDIAGQISGIYTDEEQIQWSFFIKHESIGAIRVAVTNRQNITLNFSDERLNFEFDRSKHNVIPEYLTSMQFVALLASEGAYCFSPNTYKDTFCVLVRKQATSALVLGYIDAFGLMDDYSRSDDLMNVVTNTPERPVLISRVLALRDKYRLEEENARAENQVGIVSSPSLLHSFNERYIENISHNYVSENDVSENDVSENESSEAVNESNETKKSTRAL